jgi:hypothetical protein
MFSRTSTSPGCGQRDGTTPRQPAGQALRRHRLAGRVAAAAFGITVLAAGAGTAAAATTGTAAPVSSAVTTANYSPNAPLAWLYYGEYGTLHACRTEGNHLQVVGVALSYKCPSYSGGSYIYYRLYVTV